MRLAAKLAILLALPAFGQTPLPLLGFGVGGTVAAGGGITLVCHVAAISAAGNAITTAAVNCTGANLLVVSQACKTGSGYGFSDSSSNTWSALTVRTNTILGEGLLRYVYNPTVTSSQTFTASGTVSQCSIAVAGFSGTTGSTVDQQNGASGVTSTTIQPGSITPSGNGYVVILGNSQGAGAGTVSVNSGLTITDTKLFSPGTAYGTSLAYLVQTSAAAINPTWTYMNSIQTSAFVASFK